MLEATFWKDGREIKRPMDTDFWEKWNAAIDWTGITDANPVRSQEEAKEVERKALIAHRSAQAVAASGGNLGKKSKGRK